jgi:hypothetical protein
MLIMSMATKATINPRAVRFPRIAPPFGSGSAASHCFGICTAIHREPKPGMMG